MSEQDLAGWSRVNLTDLASYINGYAFKPEDWSEHGLPIVRIAQITGSSADCDYYRGRLSEDFKINNGDIIFSWSGTLCVVQWRGGPAWLNQHLFKVRPAEGVSHRLLYHVLSHAVAEMDKSAHGSTMKHIKRGELKRYQILFPDCRQEQEKIGRVLDTLDTQIQQTEALIAKLEKVKEGLLHDLLIRGIDQNGQLRPSPEQAPELYKESPLGLIPREWQSRTFGETTYGISYGFTNPMPSTSAGPWMLTAADIAGGRISYSSARHTSFSAYSKLSLKSKPKPGELLITKDGTLGRVAIVDQEEVCINQSVASCMPRDPDMINFIFYYLVSHLGQEAMFADAGGSTIKHLYVSKLIHMFIPIPEAKEAMEVSSRLSSLFDKVEAEKKSYQELVKLKAGLMDDLLTGRVRVSPLLEQAEETTSA